MDLIEDWDSKFVNDPSSDLILGPLLFNSNPPTLTSLFSSQLSLSPLYHRPHLSLLNFLTNSSSDSSLSLSTSSSIASYFRTYQNNVDSYICHNRLQLLHCSHNNKTVVFFPSGINSDRVGFVVLSVDDGNLDVSLDNGDVFMSNKQFNHPIEMLLVRPHYHLAFHGKDDSPSIGYLLACTMYSIHWFSVVIQDIGLESERPSLLYLQSKNLNSCSIVHACWSPHLAEESLVLLENGELFLFDLDSCLKRKGFCKGTKLKVNWNNLSNSENHKWLSCEFSFHPRILIVARSDQVFLADLRGDKQNISCLAKIDVVEAKDSSVEKDRFIAFCKAGNDGFHFALASNGLLLLYDVRELLKPLLKWDHKLEKPCYIDVFRLSELRSNSRNGNYEWASKLGFCIVLGSFWNNEFSLFCYGPAPRGSVPSKVPTVSKPLCKWKLPSELPLSGRDYFGGDSLVREELFKDSLPEWIKWQQKRKIVFGFSILNKDIAEQLSEPHEFGGFTLIRLISPGKLESQRYHASWESVSKLEKTDKETSLDPVDNFLYSSNEKYKFPKRNKYLKLEYLNAYLNGNLMKVLDINIKKHCMDSQEKNSFNPNFHVILCEKLKACGLGRSRSSPAVVVALNDTSLPTRIREVALRRIWGVLPMELLQLAFSCYSEFLELHIDNNVPLEFLVVSDLTQLPPFLLREPSRRSNKWSYEVQPSDALVGPVLPLPILLTLHEFRNGSNQEEEDGDFAPEVELSIRSNEIAHVAFELSVSYHGSGYDDYHAVSLADDEEKVSLDSQKAKPFFLCHPVELKKQDNSICKDETFGALICKVAEKERVPQNMSETVTQEMFDDLCPINLKFNDRIRNVKTKESQSYNVFRRQFSKWQESYDLYQDFCSQGKFLNQGA